jgi:hypothetical protein
MTSTRSYPNLPTIAQMIARTAGVNQNRAPAISHKSDIPKRGSNNRLA